MKVSLSGIAIFILTIVSYELITVIPRAYSINIQQHQIALPVSGRILLAAACTIVTLILSFKFYKTIKELSGGGNKKTGFLITSFSYLLLYAALIYHFTVEFDISLLDGLPGKIVGSDIFNYIFFYYKKNNVTNLLYASFIFNIIGSMIFYREDKAKKWSGAILQNRIK